MRALGFGVVAGLVFGIVDVVLMIPLEHPNKSTAMTGAFLSRFAIGFLVPLVQLPWPPWARGAVVGLLISLPDAVITSIYAPILVVGVVGGSLIGWASGSWIK